MNELLFGRRHFRVVSYADMKEIGFEDFYELALLCKGQGFALSPIESDLIRKWYERCSDKSHALEALEATLVEHFEKKKLTSSKNLSIVSARRKVEKALGMGA